MVEGGDACAVGTSPLNSMLFVSPNHEADKLCDRGFFFGHPPVVEPQQLIVSESLGVFLVG
jgi:hypothetical protein